MHFLKQYSIHIFCITESWLINSIPDSFVAIDGYTILRNDTVGDTTKHGVCVYIKNCIKFDSVSCECNNALVFRLVDFDFWVVAVYRPPSNQETDNVKLLNFIDNCCNGHEVIIIGDFNLPSLKWSTAYLYDHYILPLDRSFLFLFEQLGLTQWIQEPTFIHSNNILDLILTTEKDRVGSVELAPPFPKCGHTPVICHYIFQSDQELNFGDNIRPVCNKLLWYKGNYDSLNEEFYNIDWHFEFEDLSVEDCYKKFCKLVLHFCGKLIPIVPDYPKKATPWRSKPPSELLCSKQNLWRVFLLNKKNYGRNSDQATSSLNLFHNVNSEYMNFAITSQISYELSLIVDSRRNPKLFHFYIRSMKKGRPSIGPLKLSNSSLSDDPLTMANCLADGFSSVYRPDIPSHPEPHQSSNSSFSTFMFTLADVEALLSKLDVNSSTGPDDISPFILNRCAKTLSYPLFLIFSKSLNEGAVPSVWKRSIVHPLYKKGPRYNPLNYRPISITSVCCKTLERIIVSHLNEYLDTNLIISEKQFGFRRGKSTIDQLILTYDEITKFYDEGYVVDLGLLDFEKVFDVVNHETLLDKLFEIGILPPVLFWIKDFLVGRIMNVLVDGVLSADRSVLSGVPQGSVLGPILFLIFINHICSTLQCYYVIFADDLKLYVKLRLRSDLQNIDMALFQHDLDLINKVAKSWGLSFNLDKCVILRFMRGNSSILNDTPYSMNGHSLKFVDTHTDLGVTINKNLKFHTHVHEVARKAGGLAANLLKSTLCRSEEFMLDLFKTHIRPIMDYASPLWNTGYVEDTKALESVQRRWTKKINGFDSLEYQDRLAALRLFSVKGRLLRSDIIYCWKIFHGKCGVSPEQIFILSNSSTRGHSFKIYHVRSTIDVRQKFFSVRIIPVWNNLPNNVVSCTTLATFKTALHSHMIDKFYEI